MVNRLDMKMVLIPSAKDNGGKVGPIQIYSSLDFCTNKDKCLVIIQGSGKVRAGYYLYPL